MHGQAHLVEVDSFSLPKVDTLFEETLDMNDLLVSLDFQEACFSAPFTKESSQYATIRILAENGAYVYYPFTSLFLVCVLHIIHSVQISESISWNIFLRFLTLQCFI